ncbi:hypothetical protein [Corynebacterium pseudotuberculosis]|uniref:hypothetical protein n=1 Tax=Corynebacterium pseudotuberculosis TaxID=1719 RepID=UPI0001DD44AE|nr:hypothetical protein [Corynebacterium pseudotuberculosis]AEK93126.1 Hypothetical protein CpPAT10_1805 [Corynebacterium pseudotuberculosis PAT10]AEP71033.1 Hypothetical protein Cp4202_1794 [Corynebacterium pseudotuberculosis 42/02-A]AEX40302.1 Hypothetical protein Cp3995_1851 [Corynebacterium pseudotuberculosis 3/99-5]AFF22951.1 Hypothetical protein CpP54B96_1833 [Corynebacterium pseudotuberculosis P54B96]AFH52753.1 Hypothetical protein Cp267_1873 [Corynebacterium pseudotuberculosis 267]
MFTAIHDFLLSVLDLDLLSSEPKDYFSVGWDSFKDIFVNIGNFFSFAKDRLSAE